MIKTVSFAPPRPARAAKSVGKSASKPASAQPARAISPATPAATQPARASSGSSPTPPAEEKIAAPRRAAAAKKPVAAVEVAPVETAAKAAAPGKTRAAKVAPATAATPPVGAAPATKTPGKQSAVKTVEAEEKLEAAPEKPQPAAVTAPKIKRSRAPKDLAAQYGAAPATEDVPRNVVEKAAPRKRLTREAKAARSQMLRPDDDVLQRLQQANAVEVKKPASRGRGWEFECGRCGRVSRFQTPGAICECGAIAVKE